MAPHETTVTVMSFNIHHGQGTDGVLDLGRIARVIRASGAGVVGLQEVDRHFGDRSNGADQAAELAELLGFQVAYGANIDLDPAAPGQPRAQYGNAILSRYPIARWENTRLFGPSGPSGSLGPSWSPRSPGAEPRGLLHAEIGLPGVRLHVYVTHLAAFSESDRVRQARQVAGIVAENSPAVLLGDFNAHPGTAEIGTIGAALTDAWTATPGEAPPARIDYVFTGRGLSAEWTRLSLDDPAASDHLPVVSHLVFGTFPRERASAS